MNQNDKAAGIFQALYGLAWSHTSWWRHIETETTEKKLIYKLFLERWRIPCDPCFVMSYASFQRKHATKNLLSLHHYLEWKAGLVGGCSSPSFKNCSCVCIRHLIKGVYGKPRKHIEYLRFDLCTDPDSIKKRYTRGINMKLMALSTALWALEHTAHPTSETVNEYFL